MRCVDLATDLIQIGLAVLTPAGARKAHALCRASASTANSSSIRAKSELQPVSWI